MCLRQSKSAVPVVQPANLEGPSETVQCQKPVQSGGAKDVQDSADLNEGVLEHLQDERMESSTYVDPTKGESSISIIKNRGHFDALAGFFKVPRSFCGAMSTLNLKVLEFSSLHDLETFDFDCIARIPKLEEFVCKRCSSLKTITSDSNFVDTKQLIKLHLSENKSLTSIPLFAIVSINSLQDLECFSCPSLWAPPREISAQGGKATMQFIREVQHGGEFNRQMTLFLLGEGESGKTSVVNALLSKNDTSAKIAEDRRTVGIQFSKWSPDGAETDFVILDLAGQAIYAKTNQLLLQSRAIYLLVWRPAENLQQDHRAFESKVDDWLELLQHRMPGAYILLVVTHIDTCPVHELDTLCKLVQDTIRAKILYFKKTIAKGIPIVSVFNDGQSARVNCLNGVGVAPLRELIVSVTKQLPWYREALPASFIKLRSLIQSNVEGGHMTLEWNVVKQMAKEIGLEGIMLKTCISFLHESGALRYFGDPEEKNKRMSKVFQNTVFTSPAYIVHVMKGLIRHERDSLLHYFASIGDKKMLRRVQRFMLYGRLHRELIPYLFPSGIKGEASRDYWESVSGSAEGHLWDGMSIINDLQDVERAVGLLEGFSLLATASQDSVYPDECIVPGALRARKTHIPLDAFANNVCPLYSHAIYQGKTLPSGALNTIVVKIAQTACNIEFSENACVFYSYGHAGQLLVSTISATEVKLSINSSSKALLDRMVEQRDKMEAFFPGLVKKNTLESSSSAHDTVQVTILTDDEGLGLTLQDDLRIHSEGKYWSITVQLPDHEIENSLPARIVLVCMNATIGNNKRSCFQFSSHAKKGSHIIAVIYPAYNIQNISNWWPPTMKEFDCHKRFCDFRSARLLQQNLPHLTAQIEKFLKRWRAISSSQEGIESDSIVCDNCGNRLHTTLEECFRRKDSINQSSNITGKNEEAVIPCSQCLFSNEVNNLITVSSARMVVPCPLCLLNGTVPPGYFSRYECRLKLHELDTERISTVMCSVCQGSSSVMDLAPPEAFISYHRGPRDRLTGKYSTQEAVRPLVSEIEDTADVFCWFDVQGGLDLGQNPIREMCKGVKGASVVIIFLSDSYIVSEKCRLEFETARDQKKYVIPILVQHKEGTDVKEGISAGWTGIYDSDTWWYHTLDVNRKSSNKYGATSLTDWSYLANFRPIFMTEDRDALVNNIVQQVLSRSNRPVVCLSLNYSESNKESVQSKAEIISGNAGRHTTSQDSSHNVYIHSKTNMDATQPAERSRAYIQATSVGDNANYIQMLWDDSEFDACVRSLTDLRLDSVRREMEASVWDALLDGTVNMGNLCRVQLR
jgi:GTPase SAR1 family protein